MKFFMLVFIAALSGCATVSDDVSLKTIGLQERVYVGRFLVRLNGVENPRCELYLNYDISPSVQLSPDGWFIFKTDRQKLQFRTIACLHQAHPSQSAWHHQKLRVSALERSENKNEVQYFGDVEVGFEVDPKATVRAAIQDESSLSHVKIGQAKNSGEVTVKIVSRFEEAKTHFTPELTAKSVKNREFIWRESLLKAD